MRVLILPNLPAYSSNLLQDALTEDNPRRPEAERVLDALLMLLATLWDQQLQLQLQPRANGHSAVFTDDLREKLAGKIGGLLAARVAESGDVRLAYSILQA